MKAWQQEEREVFNILTLFALMVRCPLGTQATSACPFARFRDNYELEEKYRLAERLPEARGREMLAAHEICQAEAYAREVMLGSSCVAEGGRLESSGKS